MIKFFQHILFCAALPFCMGIAFTSMWNQIYDPIIIADSASSFEMWAALAFGILVPIAHYIEVKMDLAKIFEGET